MARSLDRLRTQYAAKPEEMMKQAEFFKPVDPAAELIGKKLTFKFKITIIIIFFSFSFSVFNF